MIAARQIAFGKAAGKGLSAKDYIQDGLVAMWDSIENAGWGVHDETTGSWVDLSGNGYDLEVIGGQFTENGFKCMSYGCGARNVSKKLPFNNNLSYYEFVVTITGVFQGSAFILDGGQYDLSTKTGKNLVLLQALDQYQRKGVFTGAPSTFYRIDNNYTFPPGTYCFCVDYNYLRFDNEIVTEVQSANVTRISGSEEFLNVGGGDVLNCSDFINIRTLRCYSERPAESLIQYNYEIDKARFGL